MAAVSALSDPGADAVVLAEFLGALHGTAPADAPANPVRGIPLRGRSAMFETTLEHLDGTLDRPAVLAVWRAALAAPEWTGAPMWLHGDLHPANILVSGGRISGVIDFGDVTAGDPATDLAVAWMLLPAGCHAAFRQAYAAHCPWGADESTWVRARGWALALSLALLGHSADNPMMAAVGQRTLDAVLAPPAG